MPFLPAPAAEPRHTRGGAGGAGRGQWVCYPLRVITDAEAYAPIDTNVYGKWRALSQRRPATASMDKAASFLGLSKSTMERASRRLGTPAPTDGVQELFTKRKTHKVTGTGQTAERWCRDHDRGEAYVWAPVRAADTLRGLEHRLYLGLRYAIVVKGHQPTLAELAQLLRHHGGKLAGQALAEASVARLLDRLATLGWIGLDKRAGYRGRHLITVHDDPVRLVDEPDATPDPDDGSGPDLGDGSPAYKEDLQLNDLGSTEVRGSSAVGEVTVSGCPPVDNSAAPSVTSAPEPTPVAATFRPDARPAGRLTYAGPQLTVSPRVAAVLEPVADLLADVRPFVMRRIGREIGRQLDAGIWPEDIRDQLDRLRRWTPAEELRDPGRWLLGAVLPARSHCNRPNCYWGFLTWSGDPCKVCAAIKAARPRAAHPPHTAWHECRACQAPSRRHLPAGLCTACRPTA